MIKSYVGVSKNYVRDRQSKGGVSKFYVKVRKSYIRVNKSFTSPVGRFLTLYLTPM